LLEVIKVIWILQVYKGLLGSFAKTEITQVALLAKARNCLRQGDHAPQACSSVVGGLKASSDPSSFDTPFIQ